MAVKFLKAHSRYQRDDIAVFAPAMEEQLVKQGYAEVYTEKKEEAPVGEKDSKPDPKTERNPEKPQTRQTTVGPQKR